MYCQETLRIYFSFPIYRYICFPVKGLWWFISAVVSTHQNHLTLGQQGIGFRLLLPTGSALTKVKHKMFLGTGPVSLQNLV